MSDVSRARRKALRAIEHDLKKIGSCTDIIETSRAKGPAGRFLSFFQGPGFGDTEEFLCVSAHVYRCPVVIIVPIAKWGFTPPYLIETELPEPMTGVAEYRRGLFGCRWHTEPKDKGRISDLKCTVPAARMKENQVSKKIPVQCKYSVAIGHSFAPTDHGGTRWVVQTAWEGGLLSGGHRPKVGKYLGAVPAVCEMLKAWQRQGLPIDEKPAA